MNMLNYLFELKFIIWLAALDPGWNTWNFLSNLKFCINDISLGFCVPDFCTDFTVYEGIAGLDLDEVVGLT